jgi:O-antigen/teichoic acid export membrane protein
VSFGIAKKLLKGSSARVFAQILTMIVGLALLPIVVKSLGDELYGVWIIVGSIGGYYGLLDFGLSSAVARYVSKELGRNDSQKVNGYISSSIYLFTGIGVLVFLVSIIAAFFVDFLGVEVIDKLVLQKVIIILGLSTAVAFPSRVFTGVLTSYLRYDLVSFAQILTTLLRSVFMILILFQGGKLIAISVLTLGFSLFNFVLLMLFFWKVHKEIPVRIKDISKVRMKELFSYGKYSFVAQVSDLLRQNAFPLVLGFSLGAIAVTNFSIANRLLFMVGTLCASMFSVFTPVFSRLEGQGDFKKIKEIYFFALKISSYGGLFIIAFAGIMAEDFVELWLGEDKVLDVIPIAHALLASFMVAVIQMPTVNLLYGLSKNKFYAITNLIQGLGSIALAIPLMNLYGGVGAAYAISFVAFFVKLVIQPLFAVKVLSLNLVEYYLKFVLRPSLIPLSYLVLVYFVAMQIEFSWLTLIVFSLVTVVFYAPYIYYLGLIGDEKAKMIGFIKTRRLT